MEVIRLDEEPVPKTGRGASPWAFESPRFRFSPRWSRGQDTGPSTRRAGFDSPSRYAMPGGRAERRPAVTRKAGVRSPPWQPSPVGRGGFTDRPRGRRSTARMRARHARDEGSTPFDHTFPDTPTREGGGDMPTTINPKLISWASDIDP